MAAGAFLLIATEFTGVVRPMIARHNKPQPQAILVLGGGVDRIRHLTEWDFALESDLPIYYSSGASAHVPILTRAGIDESRVTVDMRAFDTLTNFTTLRETFLEKGYRHVAVVTNEAHAARASAIARIVFGSSGIAYTFELVEGRMGQEPFTIVVRDWIRAYVWRLTGWKGECMLKWYRSRKYRGI